MQDKLTELIDHYKVDTEFLLKRNWRKTNERFNENNFFCYLWSNNAGIKYPHFIQITKFSVPFAIEIANKELLKEKGWKFTKIKKIFPVNKKGQRIHMDEYYIHPENNNLFSYWEALHIEKNSDREYANWVFEKTKQLKEIIDVNKEYQEVYIYKINKSSPPQYFLNPKNK
jgi:hypothetical protein